VAQNQAGALVCAIGVLGYVYRTVFVRPDGTRAVRTINAILGLPTTIDVDGDGWPDLVGTITVSTGANGLTLSISRLLTFSATAPVSVEAILTNPTAAQSYVGVGYDGTRAGNPQGFSATVSLVSLTTTGTELGVSVSNSGPPPSMGLVAEMFQGDRDNPNYAQRGWLGLAPVPATINADLKFQPAHLEAAVTTSEPSLVTPQLHMTSPGREQDVDVSIDRLPQTIDLAYDNANTLTYTGSAPINQLGLAYHDYADRAIAMAAALDATAVPTGITVGFGSQLSVQTSGGAVGSVEARLGQGQEVPPKAPGAGPYASYHKMPTTTTAAARIAGLSALTVNLAGPYALDLALAQPVANLDLSAADDTQGVAATGRLSNMPVHTTMTADLGTGQLSVDGHGTGINSITLHATKTTPFFARAKRIDLTATGLPASETLNFQQQPGGVTATASAPIGQLNLSATDGGDAPAVPAPYGAYASFADQPSRYLALAVINGFQGASFGYDPSTAALRGSFDVAQRQTLGLEAHVGAGDFSGSIDQLPTHVDFSLGAGAGGDRLAIVNASQAVGKITISGTNLALGPFPATSLAAVFTDLPPHLQLTIPGAGGAYAFNASAADGTTPAAIGEIYFQAWQSAQERALAPDTVYFDDRPGTFRAALDLTGLQAFSFNPASYSGSITTMGTPARDLTADVLHGAQVLHSVVHSLPSQLSFSLAADGAGTEVVDYTASSAISRITLTASGLGDLHLPLGATDISVQIDNLPSRITLTIPAANGSVSLDLHGGRVGDVLARIYGASGPGGPALSGRQRFVYDEQNGRIAADLYQVGSFTATTTMAPETTTYDISSSMPLDYDYRKPDGTYLVGTIANPQPARIVVDPNFNGSGNVTLTYAAQAPIDSISLSTNAVGFVNATVEHVPEHLTACINPTGYVTRGSTKCLAGAFKQMATYIPPFGMAGLCIVPLFEGCDTTYPIVPANLALQFFPTDAQGNPPAQPISVSGDFCPHNGASECVYRGPAKPEIIHIDHLRFGVVQIAMGAGPSQNPDGGVGNQGWVGFDTGATPLTGFLSYTKPGETNPFFIFNADADQGGSLRSQGFMFVIDNPGGWTVKSYKLLNGCISYTDHTSASVNILGYKNIIGYLNGFAC